VEQGRPGIRAADALIAASGRFGKGRFLREAAFLFAADCAALRLRGRVEEIAGE
jgi:hypothetical protein